MKIRAGFVSNSSSSSFVVAVEGDADEVELLIKVNLSKYADGVATTKEELDKLIIEEYGWRREHDTVEKVIADEGEYVAKVYAETCAAIEAGKRVIFGTVSNDYDDATRNLLYDDGLPESPGIDILRNTR